ncbi:cytochrome C assembly family protein [Oceanobacillus halotolerans]|uniref:cytochrome C assembly family protein n=1 Tax=Oceanobacillus halotolerans TaxID=2663380 RepID=UPI0013DB24DD|nr:cytochrome c biogenesis protein CcsA [Oceanobacillus halotolerans]
MDITKWMYEIILVIYGLSLVGYFIDFIQHNRKANRIAFWLLSMVWLLQTSFLCIQLISDKSFPITTLQEGLFFYAWILVTFSLLMNRLFTIHFIVFFTNVFTFFILLLAISMRIQAQMEPSSIQFVHEILITHITLAIVSYGFFTLAFIFSLMYLTQYYFLKKKQGLKWMWRFGDLKRLDIYSFTAITLGVPLLLIGIIYGIVWAYSMDVEFYWLDIKTIGSILVLGVYILYLLLRIVRGYRGRSIAIYNTAAFLVLLINFFLFSLLSNFHF